ncbi:hypothetical protein JCM19046_121 [Bacillus sp. JCM 19046]|nr:hypothetical protein JCM19045_2290 [Bacillus sp. JCM 19045]GAF15725.1 hypothetical protein JCM19046_121 [Bacillus sp. JCM 19046]
MNIVFKIHQGLQKVAKQLGVEKTGFRVVSNNGPDGQQEVDHLHYHLMGGRQLKWEI